MSNAKRNFIAASFLAFLFGSLFIVTVSSLIQERSKDIVRVTVDEDNLLKTVGELQLATGKVAYAYSADDTGKRWRIVIDERSESF